MIATRLLIGCLLLSSLATQAMTEPATLDGARAAVREKFPRVQSIAPDALDEAREGDGILLLDTRSEEEFKVSHIPGATRVDPKMSAIEFLSRYGEAARGKTVVFYCSVGARSSALADRVTSGLTEKRAVGVRSLDGGVFAWSQQDRPLENADGPTKKVDGYDPSWGKSLEPPASKTP